ncbi:DUF1292 domain-containing protein [Clostridium rectalis]|uniref:DUF1292 domain-containing protein n=1 Tax=Clostridium rectalis TaxID=2040295 RepID=UPI000F63A235|nr:DUF1292 domain-containing protein [Clostridium rectalis]
MQGKVYSFRNENGELVKFTVKEYLELNKNEYILMSPENDKSHIDVYKFNYSHGNEALELVEDEQELSKIKSLSKVI